MTVEGDGLPSIRRSLVSLAAVVGECRLPEIQRSFLSLDKAVVGDGPPPIRILLPLIVAALGGSAGDPEGITVARRVSGGDGPSAVQRSLLSLAVAAVGYGPLNQNVTSGNTDTHGTEFFCGTMSKVIAKRVFLISKASSVEGSEGYTGPSVC